MLIPILIFFGAFEVFFLALVAFLARPVLGLVAGWAILIGNFLAAVTMLWYFFVSHRPLVQTLGGRWTAVFREGVVAGLLGGAVVAVWFLLYDTVSGRPLRTPALLGATLLEGLRDPGALDVRLDVVLGYTVVHFAVFAAFGILVSVLFTRGRARATGPPRALHPLLVLRAVLPRLRPGARRSPGRRPPLVEHRDRQPAGGAVDAALLLRAAPGARRPAPGALERGLTPPKPRPAAPGILGGARRRRLDQHPGRARGPRLRARGGRRSRSRHRGRQPPPLPGASLSGPDRGCRRPRLARRSPGTARPRAAAPPLRRPGHPQGLPRWRERRRPSQAALRLRVPPHLGHDAGGAVPRPPRAGAGSAAHPVPRRHAGQVPAEGRLGSAPAHAGPGDVRGRGRPPPDRAA